MITVKKINTLKPRTLVRKVSAVFHNAARDEYEMGYLLEVAQTLYSTKAKEVIDDSSYEKLNKLIEKLKNGEESQILFEDLSQLLLSVLGSEPSDWDFVNEHGGLDGEKRTILSHSLILDRLRSPFNVGSIFRTSDSFGIDKITLIEGTADLSHPRCERTSRGTIKTVDHCVINEEEVIRKIKESGKPVFALELGGTNIKDFPFPKDGIGVIGSEEFGVSPQLLKLCDSSLGRVSIPLAGSKGSINVSVATGIMLQAWFSKED